MAYVYDIETDGLLDDVSKIHCICIMDTDTGEIMSYGPGRIEQAISLLNGSDVIGHNLFGYDECVLRTFYPDYRPKSVTDTLIISRLIYANMYAQDEVAAKHGTYKLPKESYGRHSLDSWGKRLGEWKGDYAAQMKEQGLDPWSEFNDDMLEYCIQDVKVSYLLWQHLSNHVSYQKLAEPIQLEHDVARIIARQWYRGFHIDLNAAYELHADLVQDQKDLERQLKEMFQPIYRFDKLFVPKRDDKRHGYVKDAPLSKVKLQEFNPNSRQQIAERLQALGWKPEKTTPKGSPEVSEKILDELDYPEAKPLKRYLMLTKRLSQLVEGDEAILTRVKNGRVHGQVNPVGTRTFRMTHSKPNVAQTPNNNAEYGERFRELYCAGPGYVLVGCDAEGLELRCLSHFLARYDEGEYVKAVTEGSKHDGSDAHTKNQRAVNLNKRDNAKTFLFALIYGSGDYNLGLVIYSDMTDQQKAEIGKPSQAALSKLGKAARQRLESKIPAFGEFVSSVKAAHKSRNGRLRGLDGRFIVSPSEHSAVNTVIQTAGAIIMKRALVIADNDAQAAGMVPGMDYEFVANIHDEFQAESIMASSDKLGQIFADAIRKAGEYYGFRCPLAGEYKVGSTWKDTH